MGRGGSQRQRKQHGKRSYTKTSRKRGRYVSSRDAGGKFIDLAVDATLRQAAPHQIDRRGRLPARMGQDSCATAGDTALLVEAADLRRKMRIRRAANLILFVVDASWSMAAARKVSAAARTTRRPRRL